MKKRTKIGSIITLASQPSIQLKYVIIGRKTYIRNLWNNEKFFWKSCRKIQ